MSSDISNCLLQMMSRGQKAHDQVQSQQWPTSLSSSLYICCSTFLTTQSRNNVRRRVPLACDFRDSSLCLLSYANLNRTLLESVWQRTAVCVTLDQAAAQWELGNKYNLQHPAWIDILLPARPCFSNLPHPSKAVPAVGSRHSEHDCVGDISNSHHKSWVVIFQCILSVSSCAFLK